MAFLTTIDERYGGGFLGLGADDLDASNLLNSTFLLAEGIAGYGNLTDQYLTADQDVYSLGVLSTGRYTIDVDDFTWDFSSTNFGFVSRFELLDANGFVIAASHSSFSDIDFSITSPGTFYVKVIGSSFGEQQYRVSYSRIGDLNTPAVFAPEASYVGELKPGGVIDASVIYYDLDGNSDNITYTGWYLDGVYQGEAEFFAVLDEDVGKVLSFEIGFIDDLGNLEISGKYVAGVIGDNAPVGEPPRPSSGGRGDDRLIGSSDDDTLNGRAGDDKLFGGGGEDRLIGGGGNDLLKGDGDDDVLLGGGGRDVIRGGSGDDLSKGNGGADRLFGNGGDDTLLGGGDNDRLVGGGGHDRLVGSGGRDTLLGGGGKDTLSGGRGDDVLNGGQGPDRFVFGRGDGADRIKGFRQGQDKIEIGRGANDFDDLTISKVGRNVLIEFANVDILVEKANVNTFDEKDFVF